MSKKSQKSWSQYHRHTVIQGDEFCNSVIAENDAGEKVIIHHVSFSSDTPPAVRMRLKYETARLALMSCDRMTVPLDFEFNEANSHVICPWIPGRTLADQLASSQLSIAATLGIAEDLLLALEALHEHGLIRRCLLPREIIIGESSGNTRAFIGGFGPLMMLQGWQNTAVGIKIAAYTSPEALGALDEDVRAASDLYSLGIVLFECLTGHVPFVADNVGELIFHHMTSPIPDPTLINSLIPRHLSDIVLRLLQKHPRDRYQSAAGVLYDLRQIETVVGAANPQCLVLGTKDRRESLIEPAFVGRSRDMTFLRSELEAVAQGVSRTVLVTAAAGLGKSRLLLEISRIAVSNGFRVFRAQGQNQIGLAGVASLRGILSQCMALIREDEALKSRLQTELSEFGRELMTVVPELVMALALHVSTERMHDLSDRRIAIALATLLRALGTHERPVLILLDDMHWADDLTLTMLECWHLSNSTSTLLIVGTQASDTTATRLRDNLNSATNLTLEPLVRADHDRLLGSMTGGLPGQILATVWKMSAGNPFMASAVLRGLVEGRVLTPSASGWQLDERKLQHLQMSGEAAEVMKQRLFLLSKESKDLLSIGAILGKDFPIEMVADLAEITAERVLELLVEPRRNCLIWERASGSICSFMHDLIQDAALQCLTPLRRELIHLRAAAYLIRVQPHRVCGIAFHYDASGRPDLARDYAIEAGELARTGHALESAEQQYRIALRGFSARFEEPNFRVLYGLGDVLMLSGRYGEAAPFFERAITCADSTILRAEVTLKLGELALREDRTHQAVGLWESALCSLGGRLPSAWMLALATVREIGVQALHTLLPRWFLGRLATAPSASDRLLWRLHSRLSHAYLFSRSRMAGLHLHLRCMNLAERYQPTAELAQVYAEHAPAMSLIPLSTRGIVYGERSLKIRTAQNDFRGQGQSLHFLAIALYSAAKFEECVNVGRRSVWILERAGDFWKKHVAQYQVAAALYRLGRFTEAANLAREVYESGLANGDFQICGKIIEVWMLATNGSIPLKILECELARPREDVQGQAQVLLAQGVHFISEGRFEEALKSLDQGINVARVAGISNCYTSPLFAWKATALRGLLENKTSLTCRWLRIITRDHHRAARKALLIALRFRNELPHALREYASAELYRNCNRRAIFLLQKSIQTANLQSAEYELIQSNLLLQKIRVEVGYLDAEKELRNAERRYSAFRDEQFPQRISSSMSLVDRFESLLDSGRKIVSAIEPTVIIDNAAEAARRLLRSNHCKIIYIDESGQPAVQSEAIRACVLTSLRTLDVFAVSGSDSEFRSLLACPIVVRSRVAACLVVCNSEVRNLFGPNELRIAKYLATLAGAGLENAEGFSTLQDLNSNLERIVKERTTVAEARATELQETADHLRHVQTQLAAARDSAESASRAKSDFLAHMSHEIRTPLGAVLGFTELVLNSDAPLLPIQHAHLQRVLSNGNHLHNLLNDILDLSQIEAGALTVESIACAPYAILHEILSAMQSRAITKNLMLTLKVAAGIPEQIFTDPTRLRQILTNLIGNAIKFTAAGSVSLIVDTNVDQNQLRIRVQDTGLGIDVAAQNKVFEPFKQADETVARHFGGTGLGLPISRKLAQALGGDIVLASERGFGSTFCVTIATGSLNGVRILNGREAEATLMPPVAEREKNLNLSLKGFRILIADDVEANRAFFAHVLHATHAECLFACNGQEAVEIIQRENVDLVLMDIMMPVLDGCAATQMLRSAGVKIPIVAITANGTEDDQQRCRELGFTGYLTKPISILSLLRGISEQLGGVLEHTSVRLENSPTAIPVIMNATIERARTATTRPVVTLPVDPVFRDFSSRFLRKIQDSLPQMMSAIDAANGTTLAGLAHWIMGTGGTVGLPGLTNIGRELQALARAEDYLGARIIALELQTIVARLQCELQSEPAIR